MNDLLTTLGFALRNCIRWSRPGYQERFEDKAAFFQAHPDLISLETSLLASYPSLNALKAKSGLNRYLENLNLIEALTQLTPELSLPKTTDEPLSCLEVGVKNWSTLSAIAAFLNTRNYVLSGIEIDPWRVYQDLHSRWDYAQAYRAEVPQASYLTGNVLNHQGQYELIAVFLPFLFETPHAKWGLPKHLFNPQAFFEHLINHLLVPGGILLITNQGEEEFQAQQALLAPYPLQVHFSGILSQSFLSLHYPRYGWCVEKL